MLTQLPDIFGKLQLMNLIIKRNRMNRTGQDNCLFQMFWRWSNWGLGSGRGGGGDTEVVLKFVSCFAFRFESMSMFLRSALTPLWKFIYTTGKSHLFTGMWQHSAMKIFFVYDLVSTDSMLPFSLLRR